MQDGAKADTKNIVKPILILFVAFLAVLIYSLYLPGVHAETYNTNSYDVRIIVNKDNTFDYTETIEADFFQSSHGIYRNIPMSGDYAIRNVKVEGHKYELIKNSGFNKNLVIKIGSADEYIDGPQKYVIKYTIQAYDHKGKDFLYLDLFPSGWPTTVTNANVKVEFPKDFPLDNLKTYSSGYSVDDFQYGTMNIDNVNKRISFSAENMPSNTGVTIGKNLPAGYWQGAKTKGFITSTIILMGLVVIFILRFTLGRNPKVIQTVEFNSPEDLPPLELGYVIDGKVDKKDISSTLFYLADKGYLKIHDLGNEEFEFELTEYPKGEKSAIKLVFDGIFGNGASKGDIEKGERVRSDENVGKRLGDKVHAVEGAVAAEFVGDRSLFSADSEHAYLIGRIIFLFANFIVFFVCEYYTGLATHDYTNLILQICIMFAVAGGMTFLMSLIVKAFNYRHSVNKSKTILRMTLIGGVYLFASICAAYITSADDFSINDSKVYYIYLLFLLITPILMCGMRSRSTGNAGLLGRVLGFKNFIATAELSKLEELITEDPNYFYNILPYAYVFGLTKKWADKFEHIVKPSGPDWYVSSTGIYNGNIFNAYMLTSMVDNVSTSMINTINAVDTADYGGIFSGSGFGGGGGFSGGGFGGGGGGSW